MTWRRWHDRFVYFLHGLLTGHKIAQDARYDPPRPGCLTCGR